MISHFASSLCRTLLLTVAFAAGVLTERRACRNEATRASTIIFGPDDTNPTASPRTHVPGPRDPQWQS